VRYQEALGPAGDLQQLIDRDILGLMAGGLSLR
jgi:hypothetical protein